MRVALALTAALVAAGCATPMPQEHPCDIEVGFGSFAMGIDHDLERSIRAVIEATPDVQEVEETRWGREGELSLCIVTRNAVAADRLYERIAALVPEFSARAPTTVAHIDGRTRYSVMPNPER